MTRDTESDCRANSTPSVIQKREFKVRQVSIIVLFFQPMLPSRSMVQGNNLIKQDLCLAK